MSKDIISQFAEVGLLFLVGLVMGIVFVLMQKFLKKSRNKKVYCMFVETSYILIYALFFGLAVFFVSDGAVKYYHFVCVVLGNIIAIKPLRKLQEKLKNRKNKKSELDKV